MGKEVIFLLYALLFMLLAISEGQSRPPSVVDGKCCVNCTDPSTKKYFSIAHNDKFTALNCGEACMIPKDYWIYKVFEKNLTLAATNTPCADKNFTVYEETPTHGFGPIKVTFDMYAHPKDATKKTY